MTAVWFALKKSLQCQSDASDVDDPISTEKKTGVCGCSRSISNLKDVIHGSKPTSCTRSIGSSKFLNPITHEVDIGNFGTLKDGNDTLKKNGNGTLKNGNGCSNESGFGGIPSKPMASFGTDFHKFSYLTCHKCGEQFAKWEAVKEHHLSKHAVTELVEGDPSRRIVELIYRANWSNSNNKCGGIERVLKVHNTEETVAKFEEYREMVKLKASKLPKKHSRCLADGNELLRFYGTTVECSLGINGSSSLCTSDQCSVCRILRHGFVNGGVGVFTTSTSGRAFECIKLCDDNSNLRKALIACRVIAGRIHKRLENVEEPDGQSGFDSFVGKVGLYPNIEELYSLNPGALFPCFVIICKP